MNRTYAINPRSAPPDGFVPLCFENHAQDSRVRLLGHYTLQLNAKDGTGGNNLPLILDFACGDNIPCVICFDQAT